MTRRLLVVSPAEQKLYARDPEGWVEFSPDPEIPATSWGPLVLGLPNGEIILNSGSYGYGYRHYLPATNEWVRKYPPGYANAAGGDQGCVLPDGTALVVYGAGRYIDYYDGTDWVRWGQYPARVPSAEAGPSIWAWSLDDVWVDAMGGGGFLPSLYHWDGASWTDFAPALATATLMAYPRPYDMWGTYHDGVPTVYIANAMSNAAYSGNQWYGQIIRVANGVLSSGGGGYLTNLSALHVWGETYARPAFAQGDVSLWISGFFGADASIRGNLWGTLLNQLGPPGYQANGWTGGRTLMGESHYVNKVRKTNIVCLGRNTSVPGSPTQAIMEDYGVGDFSLASWPTTVWADGAGVQTIPDGEPPYLENLDPADADEGVHPAADIWLDATDDDEGVDPATVVIRIDGSIVYQNETAEAGYTVTSTAVGPGYRYRIVHATWTPWTTKTVRVTADDLAFAPNSMDETYTFDLGNALVDTMFVFGTHQIFRSAPLKVAGGENIAYRRGNVDLPAAREVKIFRECAYEESRVELLGWKDKWLK